MRAFIYADVYLYSETRKMTSKKVTESGWHTVSGRDLYVNNEGKVVRAMKTDSNGSYVPAQIYCWTAKYNCWTNAQGTSFETVRRGIYDKRYEVF